MHFANGGMGSPASGGKINFIACLYAAFLMNLYSLIISALINPIFVYFNFSAVTSGLCGFIIVNNFIVFVDDNSIVSFKFFSFDFNFESLLEFYRIALNEISTL